jgi:hypothetical protein
MRRILVDHARCKKAQKRGGDARRVDIDPAELATQQHDDKVLALDEALAKLEQQDPTKAELVKLRYFAGLPWPWEFPPRRRTVTGPTRGPGGPGRPVLLAPVTALCPSWSQAIPRTKSMSRPSMRSPSARRPLCSYSLVIHGRRPRIATAVSSANFRSTYRSLT